MTMTILEHIKELIAEVPEDQAQKVGADFKAVADEEVLGTVPGELQRLYLAWGLLTFHVRDAHKLRRSLLMVRQLSEKANPNLSEINLPPHPETGETFEIWLSRSERIANTMENIFWYEVRSACGNAFACVTGLRRNWVVVREPPEDDESEATPERLEEAIGSLLKKGQKRERCDCPGCTMQRELEGMGATVERVDGEKVSVISGGGPKMLKRILQAIKDSPDTHLLGAEIEGEEISAIGKMKQPEGDQ